MTILGPSVASIGWIPYEPMIGGRLPTAYRRHPRSLALRAVLRSGNEPEPPIQFLGPSDYRGFIDTFNFRAALSLSSVKLLCDPAGIRDAELKFIPADFVGYTPMQVKGRFGKFRYDLAWHEKGEGLIFPPETLSASPTHATIRRTVEFRIGKLGNLGSRAMTGAWAPCVWMSLEYTLRSDGSAEVNARGSYIPSQSLYGSWSRKFRRSMLAISGVQLSRFFATGADLPAPGRFQGRIYP